MRRGYQPSSMTVAPVRWASWPKMCRRRSSPPQRRWRPSRMTIQRGDAVVGPGAAATGGAYQVAGRKAALPLKGPLHSARQTRKEAAMADTSEDARERWAFILGASSGFGAATALALARDGYGIVGVHLDLRGTVAGRRCRARPDRRDGGARGLPQRQRRGRGSDAPAVDGRPRATLRRARRAAGADPFVAVFLHSLAFGTTLPYLVPPREAPRRSARSSSR